MLQRAGVDPTVTGVWLPQLFGNSLWRDFSIVEHILIESITFSSFKIKKSVVCGCTGAPLIGLEVKVHSMQEPWCGFERLHACMQMAKHMLTLFSWWETMASLKRPLLMVKWVAVVT